MPGGFRTAMHCKMLRGGNNFEVLRVFSLQSMDECNARCRSQKWIFTVGFLATPPAGISEDVDVWRPVRQPGIPAEAMIFECFIVLRASLRCDDIPYALYKVRIPG